MLEKFDPEGMYKIYDKWPQIANESYEFNCDVIDFKNINHIVFVGMGGSGTVGDLFSSILSKTNTHVSVVKGFHFPKTVDSNTLVLATSISGNTLETLTVLRKAKSSNCKIIAFSSGGKLKKYCLKNGIQFREINQLHSPRASFTAFLYSILKTLSPIIPVNERDIFESIKKLEILRKQISYSNLTKKNPSLDLALWIKQIPMIYYPWGLQAAAIRFKNSLQENVKIHAVTEDVIEACHNGIVAWERKSNVQPILIEGIDDYIKTKKLWKILKKFFKERNIEYKEVLTVNGNILSKLICLIYQLDYTSIYLAVLSKIDPSPVEPIEFIKDRL